MIEAVPPGPRRAASGGEDAPKSRLWACGLILLLGLGLAGCGYHLGPPTPAPPLNCCRPSGAN
jgi:hypothetical protein